ncbi:MAG: sugar phosphate isomerase/epimerase, partial [Clostridia bacterium]|nr:sugar phosphate isomerase/epimerase [Clostridia bacterium]
SCHVKDAVLDHSLTVSIRETEPGKGEVDLKYYIEQAEKYNPEMPMIIEHLPEFNQYLDAIKYVKGL